MLVFLSASVTVDASSNLTLSFEIAKSSSLFFSMMVYLPEHGKPLTNINSFIY